VALETIIAALAPARTPPAVGRLDRRIRSDNARWETLIRQAGIEPE
jgi:hypothetical protein